jgi:hypothetical protein
VFDFDINFFLFKMYFLGAHRVKMDKLRKWILAGLIVVLLSMIGTDDAIAQYSPNWAMDGAGCVPTDPAIQNDSYIITGGRIKFKDLKVGSITVICPVSAKVGNIGYMRVSYRDSTGTDISANIKSDLRRINKFNGSVNTVTGLEFDSNQKVDTNYTLGDVAVPTSHTLDDSNFYYFVQATLTRRRTSEIVEFGGVELSPGLID